MQIVYAGEPIPDSFPMSMFLAGPTPRDPAVKSWRPEALTILGNLEYAGVVFVPEPRPGTPWPEKQQQYAWEADALHASDRIVVWLCRNMQTLPGLTTNQELGRWLARDPARVVLATPEGAEHVGYQIDDARRAGVGGLFVDTPMKAVLTRVMQDLLILVKRDWGQRMVKSFDDGPMGTQSLSRERGERFVPLHILQQRSYRNWHADLVQAGNRLDDARVEWVYRVGPTRSKIFFWCLWVKVWVAAEQRWKANEVVLGRPDIAAYLAYCPAPNPLDTRIVMVDEFRSPARNARGLVRELPSGSPTGGSGLGASELEEETGLKIAPERLRDDGSRQLAATLSAHISRLFSVALSPEEMATVEQRAGEVNGIAEDTERCYLRVVTVRDLLHDPGVDWSMVGMIMKVLGAPQP